MSGPGLTRVCRWAAIAALLALLVAPQVGAADAAPSFCTVPGQITVEPDGWTRIQAPAFAAGPGELAAFAVDPVAPLRMFATNGQVVMRSVDGGCRWAETFRLSDLPSTEFHAAGPTAIAAIVVPAAAHERVQLVVRESVEATPVRPHLITSRDGGDTWVVGDGLPPQGDPVELLVADSAPDIEYLALAVARAASPGNTLLYVSRDGGASWEPAGAPDVLGQSGLPPGFADVAIDPLDPDHLWGAGPDGLWHTQDGGDHWTKLPSIPGPLAVVDVYRTPGSPARVWAFGVEASYRSDDGGSRWRPMPPIPAIDSAAHGRSPDAVMAAATQGDSGWMLGFVPARQGWVVLKQTTATADVSVDRGSPPTFYARGGDRIWKSPPFDADFGVPPWASSAPPPPSVTGACVIRDLSKVPEVADPVPSSLTPGGRSVVIPAGGSASVHYELILPARPRPVDLYFLTDASGSMGPAICGVANSSVDIAAGLVELGIDAWFGVGSYQDLPPVADCYAYRRDREVAPLDQAFVVALRRITPCGGEEPQMNALYQAATGEGDLPWIPPGQDAGFRDESIPVVVHISDEPLTEGAVYTTPEEAIAVLRDEGILQVGLGAQQALAVPWLQRVASGTGAVAETAVDCNGDGVRDVPRGEPLVCLLSGGTGRSGIQMADAILDMVRAIGDDASVRLMETTNSGAVEAIEPPTYPTVDLRADHLLPFSVTYTCGPGEAGQRSSVTLVARLGQVAVASVDAIVICTKVDVPSPPKERVSLVPPAVPPPLLPNHPPPPQAPPELAPAPRPQPQPQPQPQPHPQGAVAQQKQQQHQVALAQAATKVAEQQEYAMTSRRSRRDPLEEARIPILLGGGAISLAYGCLCLATRRRDRVVQAKTR